MDCAVIAPDLIAYHFGVIDDDARQNVEAHIAECKQCLADFIALKREIETATDRPSRIAKQRLKNAVAKELERNRRRTFSWWERPLAVGVAAAIVAAAMVAVHIVATSPVAPPYGIAASLQ